MRASAFIRLAKVFSVPAMPSATTMQPSLADWMMMPRRRSETLMVEPSLANMVEPPELAPPLRQAFSETWNSVSRLSLPVLMASKTTATVISLAMLAGGMRSSAAFWNRMVSVSASISRACWARVSKLWAAAWPSPSSRRPAKACARLCHQVRW